MHCYWLLKQLRYSPYLPPEFKWLKRKAYVGLLHKTSTIPRLKLYQFQLKLCLGKQSYVDFGNHTKTTVN